MSRIVLKAEPLLDGETALRPWRDSDLTSIVAACQDPEISRWTRVPFPYSQADGRAFLLHRHDAIHAGTLAPFAIVSAHDDDRVLGSISLMALHWDDRRADVGYWLAREARGSGHASRAVSLICRWGFAQLGIERIQLLAATGNLASQRVAERTGFSREVVLRAFLASREGWRDMVMFARLAGA